MSSSYYTDTVGRLARVAPEVRPAGISGDYTQPNARDLTSSYSPDACATPDSIKKFHHRGQEVGQSQRHWGSAGDAPADTEVRHGATSKHDGSIDECLRPALYSDKMTTLVGEQLEKNYASERTRPLGRTPQPAHPVPVPLDGFGVPSHKGESTASTMAAMREVDVLHPAGAQTDRGYNWQAAGVDPTQHRFGASTAKGESAKAALTEGKQTVLVPKMVKEFKSTVDYEVGKPRSYGFDNPADWDETKRRTRGGGTLVKASAANGFQAEQPTVKELLSSWAVGLDDGEGEGKGRKNGTARGLTGGLESDKEATTTSALRETIHTTTRTGREVKTLAKMEDEATVQQLVHPCHYVSLGVQSAYFAGGRDLESVRALAHKCGFNMTDEQIDRVFEAHAVDGLCGIEQFKNAAFAMGYM